MSNRTLMMIVSLGLAAFSTSSHAATAGGKKTREYNDWARERTNALFLKCEAGYGAFAKEFNDLEGDYEGRVTKLKKKEFQGLVEAETLKDPSPFLALGIEVWPYLLNSFSEAGGSVTVCNRSFQELDLHVKASKKTEAEKTWVAWKSCLESGYKRADQGLGLPPLSRKLLNCYESFVKNLP
ncbi:MAG: hypothetical protein AB1540_16285 [Bdellovibrionota bacterium]